jgi:hypothetical protein
MLGAFSKSLEVVVDRTVQLVLYAARTRFEVARSTGLYIATELIRKLVNEVAVESYDSNLPSAGGSHCTRA